MEISGIEILLGIAGGVALLLWAARMVRTGIERAYGASLRRALARAIQGRVRGATVGVAVGFALQSSTATALLAMPFVAGGVLLTSSGLAMLLGADLGSAVAVLVLSLDLRWLLSLLLVVGVLMFLSTEQRRPRQIGRTLVGLGLLLLSLQLIGAAAAGVSDSDTVSTVLGALGEELVLAFLIGALLAWGAHSSVAAVLLIASLAGAGVLDPTLAFVLVLGANAGAGLALVLLSAARTRAERRIPIGNLGFRLTGAVLALVALPHLDSTLLGTDPVRQVVGFHLAFNAALVLIFLPVVRLAGALLDRALAKRAETEAEISPLENPSYLDRDAIRQPRQALAYATREVLRMADWVEVMLRRSLDAFHTREKSTISELARMDDQIDRMNNDIKHYLVQISRHELDEEDGRRCMEIAAFTVKLEQIGDIVEKNLLQLARKRLASERRFSDAGWTELTDLHARVLDNLQLALNVFVSGDLETARQLIVEKERSRTLEHESSEQHMNRLREGSAASIDSSPIHLDVIRDLAQINSLLASTAYPILEQSGALLSSRLKSFNEDASETANAQAGPDSST